MTVLSVLSIIPFPAHATQVQEIVTPGGIKAWLVEEHALPLVAVKMVFTGSGSAYDTPGKEGLSGMASAMLLEGAGDKDSHAFNEELEENAIQLNFGIDEDMFRASVESLSEHKDQAFAMMALALTQPRFDDSAIDRVRAQTLSVIKEQEQQPGYILHRQWEQLAYGNHPYGKPSLGTKDSITAITKDDLSHFVQHYLSRENMVISVVGDITPEELKKLLDANFATLNAHYAPDITLAEVRLPDTAKQLVVESQIPQTMVLFGENGLKRNDPDYYNAHVMNQILGGGGALTSKLGIEVREKRGLAYGIGTQLEPMMHSAAWRGSFATRNEKVGAALDTVRATLKELFQNGPSDKEMDDARKHLVGSFVLGLDSNADIANFLINMQVYHLGKDYLDKRNAIMLAVKKEDVKRVAKNLLNPDKLLVVMVGKPNLDTK